MSERYREVTWSERNGWAVTAQVDTTLPGWPIVELRIFPDSGHVDAWVGEPSQDDPAVALEAGIGSRVLRGIHLNMVYGVLEMQDNTELGQSIARLRERSPREGEIYYAILAAAYILICQVSSQPAADLAGELGVPVRTMHTRLRKARELDLLTGTQGKAIGQLTDKAKALITTTTEEAQKRKEED
ncbi:hypothetical protein [Streptosporangium canum]|uniref:hypothetical protein n=1 Tax=Streptosporangium canum TaxID=324952 RepID=UPI003444CB40